MSVLPGISEGTLTEALEFIEPEGFGVALPSERQVTIEPMHEVILELENNESVKFTVTKGILEMYGTELANGSTYEFKGAMKVVAFTYRGAEVEIEGAITNEIKVVKEPLINVYLTLHLSLENQRNVVSQLNSSINMSKMTGPKVLILGSSNSGKSTLLRTLACYALRMERQVMLINLDPKTPMFVCPGLLSATPISDLLNVENISFGETETTGSNFYHPKQPLVRCFGLEDVAYNESFYQSLLTKMSETVFQRLENDPETSNSGIILDTPSNLSDEMVNTICDIFKINIVIQIDKEVQFMNKEIKVISLNKSTNIVEQTDQFVRQIQQRSIREYFYGIDKLSLSPYTITVNYSDFKVLKPINKVKDREIDESKIENGFYIPLEVNSSNINNSIMSIPRQDDRSSSRGYVCVLSCDDEKHKCKILLPTPSNSLPSSEFILTDFRYYE